MDFSNWQKVFSEAKTKIANSLDSAKESVAWFAHDQLSSTHIFVHNAEEFQFVIANNKKVIFVAFADDDSLQKEIMSLFPVWQTKAFIDSAELRFISAHNAKDLIEQEAFYQPIELRIYRDSTKTLQFTSMQEIIQWWDDADRKYTVDTTMDPLNQIFP